MHEKHYQDLLSHLEIVNNTFSICSVQRDLKDHIGAAVDEKSSFLISHPNLPSLFYESSEMNAETKPSLITLSQKYNRKKEQCCCFSFPHF